MGEPQMEPLKGDPSASSPPPLAKQVRFSEDELQRLREEVISLEETSVVGRIPGIRPSRGHVRDWLQSALELEPSSITDIALLGKGYFQVQFQGRDKMEEVLAESPIRVGGKIIFLSRWHHGFSVDSGLWPEHPVILRFPGLPCEYRHFLETIGRSFGVVVSVQSQGDSAAAVLGAGGSPWAKVLVSDLLAVPSQISLPRLDGTVYIQKVEMDGLPGQCLRCRRFGHHARSCPLPDRRPRRAEEPRGEEEHTLVPPEVPVPPSSPGSLQSHPTRPQYQQVAAPPPEPQWRVVQSRRRQQDASHSRPSAATQRPPPRPVQPHPRSSQEGPTGVPPVGTSPNPFALLDQQQEESSSTSAAIASTPTQPPVSPQRHFGGSQPQGQAVSAAEAPNHPPLHLRPRGSPLIYPRK